MGAEKGDWGEGAGGGTRGRMGEWGVEGEGEGGGCGYGYG